MFVGRLVYCYDPSETVEPIALLLSAFCLSRNGRPGAD